LSELTALFDPQALLKLEGVDQLDRLRTEHNPFWNRARLEITWGLLVALDLLSNEHLFLHPMRLASREELKLYHDSSYIETLELFGNMGTAFSSRFGLDTDDCPVFPNVDKYASFPVGATIDAVTGVAEGRFQNAMSLFGGFHHAMPSTAAGFCYYNDCAIAIRKYRQAYPNKKVLYLDTDAHHSDGTQQAFYNDPNVLTISTHEYSMGFFPGTGQAEEIGEGEGRGHCVNIPLPPLTDDAEYWRAFEELVPPIWKAYRPDLVFWEVGGDAHKKDPLTDLMLTLDTYQRLSRTIREQVHLGGRKLVVVGGGGYDPVATAKIWSMVLADIAEIPLPPTLPASWIDLCHKYGLEVARTGWTDAPECIDAEHRPNVHRAVQETIDTVKKLVFPVLGL
jgi:acetoin utilization protein AcuC